MRCAHPSLPPAEALEKSHGPYLEATLADARINRSMETALFVGQTGVAITPLRPSGKAMIDDRRYDVVTRGEFLEKGTPIRVVKAKGARIVVARPGKAITSVAARRYKPRDSRCTQAVIDDSEES